MSCATILNIDDATVKEFAAFQKGASETSWLAFKLDGRDLNRVVKVDGAAAATTFDEFAASSSAFPCDAPRFSFFKFHYDLGLDGKRVKVGLSIRFDSLLIRFFVVETRRSFSLGCRPIVRRARRCCTPPPRFVVLFLTLTCVGCD